MIMKPKKKSLNIQGNNLTLNLINLQVPHYFRCPISLELMRDPVTVSTGQTYDRSSIEKWVADGNHTCPATMQQLHDLTLIPNHTLRRLIQEWCVANRSRGVDRIPTPKQPADPSRIRSLVEDVLRGTARCTGVSSILSALRALRTLAKDNEKNRTLMVEADAIEAVLSAMFESVDSRPSSSSDSSLDSSDDEEQQQAVEESALGVLILLPLGEQHKQEIVHSSARMELVSRILQHGRSIESRINAASLIERIASDAAESTKLAIGETTGIFHGLVDLLVDHQAASSPRAPKSAVKALFGLCLCSLSENAYRAVLAGAAAALVEHLPAAQHADVDRTLATLELICRTAAGREAVGRHALTVPVLVSAILSRRSYRATECAAGTLLAVCSADEALQLAAVQAGVLTQLLLLIQSDCTERAKRKAIELLKLLRKWWAEDPCLSELEQTDVAGL